MGQSRFAKDGGMGGTTTTNRWQPYAWMLCGSFAFAVMSTLTHSLRDDCDWRIIAFLRAALACLFAASLAAMDRVRLVWFRPRTLWLRSIAGSISMVCAFYAVTHMGVPEVLTLSNTFPIWIALLSWPMFGEPPPGHVGLAIITAVGGVVLILDPDFDKINWAAYFALISSVFTAFAMIGLHRLQNLDSRAVVVHFSAVAALFCLTTLAVTAPAIPIRMPALQGGPLLMLLGIGISATIGQLFLTKAFAHGPPAQVAVVGLTQIVFAMIFDILIWQKPFALRTLCGMALVMAPTAWIMLRAGLRRPPLE